jgi:hypothetical protein
MNLFTVDSGDSRESLKRKSPKTRCKKTVKIFIAILLPKDDKRRNAFHSSMIKCLNIVDCFGRSTR